VARYSDSTYAKPKFLDGPGIETVDFTDRRQSVVKRYAYRSWFGLIRVKEITVTDYSNCPNVPPQPPKWWRNDPCGYNPEPLFWLD
jgi:hypothetical protein